ncbi:hypothetical protein PV721_39235 [Streptomyces sp. MB09-01]|uniref:hypothetical protein n=1 Tax=Streptomyces sp. MB09-01 TaxID=3028666 RepID=UPI0029BB572C|nr:hypothetical protein [Streptomyces sp. MB09-01]MDX3540238.1 hypothetical protein [Streptomyces sp. MB09-01]
MTAAAVGHLVRAGLLVYLGGEVEFPDVHPDQVNTLARRRDLPALLDRHVPLGPDQAARRLGVRRADFDAAVRLGFLSPVGTVEVDYKSHGGWTTVPLYSAQDVALLPLVWPLVDWQAVATVRPGRRSPLAALTPLVPGEDRVLLAEVGGSQGWAGPRPRTGAAGTTTSRRRWAVRRRARSLTEPRSFPGCWPTARSPYPRRPRLPPWSSPEQAAVRAVRLEDPHLLLADDAEDEDRLGFVHE